MLVLVIEKLDIEIYLGFGVYYLDIFSRYFPLKSLVIHPWVLGKMY